MLKQGKKQKQNNELHGRLFVAICSQEIHKVPTYLKILALRFVDHLEKCGLFSDFQYGFKSSQLTADLLTVVSDRIARAFNRSGATRAVALDISKAFDRVWHAGILHKLLRNFRSDIWPYLFYFQ